MRDSVLWRKQSRIIMMLAEALHIDAERALNLFCVTVSSIEFSVTQKSPKATFLSPWGISYFIVYSSLSSEESSSSNVSSSSSTARSASSAVSSSSESSATSSTS